MKVFTITSDLNLTSCTPKRLVQQHLEEVLRLALRFRVLGGRSPVGRCNALPKCVAPVMSPLSYNFP